MNRTVMLTAAGVVSAVFCTVAGARTLAIDSFGAGSLGKEDTAVVGHFDGKNDGGATGYFDRYFHHHDFHGGDHRHWGAPTKGGAMSAPEMDPASAGGAVALLLGGLAVMSSRRKVSNIRN